MIIIITSLKAKTKGEYYVCLSRLKYNTVFDNHIALDTTLQSLLTCDNTSDL